MSANVIPKLKKKKVSINLNDAILNYLYNIFNHSKRNDFNKVYDYYIMSTTTTLTENEMNNDNITKDVPILEEIPNQELPIPSFEFKNIIIFILVILLAFSLIGVNLIELTNNIKSSVASEIKSYYVGEMDDVMDINKDDVLVSFESGLIVNIKILIRSAFIEDSQEQIELMNLLILPGKFRILNILQV